MTCTFKTLYILFNSIQSVQVSCWLFLWIALQLFLSIPHQSLLEVSIKPLHERVVLLHNAGSPVPRGCESHINTASSIISRSIKPMLEVLPFSNSAAIQIDRQYVAIFSFSHISGMRSQKSAMGLRNLGICVYLSINTSKEREMTTYTDVKWMPCTRNVPPGSTSCIQLGLEVDITFVRCSALWLLLKGLAVML